ncbi:hypothetical protein KUTeg_024138 [Tegillarca granosa]|uniref:Uncharacterized protein n=1 Tax=Tegillarca granosa TaxID=220873 RepID=A0ABQ9DX57_TEGGR|nr:hypothetical protein KUTeg_024138 [Tegillarca granosa]
MLKKYELHLKRAKLERQYYCDQCQQSKERFSEMTDLQKSRGQEQLSYNGKIHYSFDYAQQIHYPHYALQVGPLFFKTPRKCQCLEYGLWRVMTGRHDTIEFSCMEVGHTKFHPDWHFGLWKVKWRHCTAETLQDVSNSVVASSRNGHNIPQLVNDDQHPVIFYKWKEFLKTIFKTLPGILKYHHFRMSKNYSGVVFVREYADDAEIKINLLKKQQLINPIIIPTILKAKGLDANRQWYLFEEIIPLCFGIESKDVVCPKPSIPVIVMKEERDKLRKCNFVEDTLKSYHDYDFKKNFRLNKSTFDLILDYA